MQQVTGLISEVLHCTLNHGPGSRSTVVLKGCPLRCIWCQSPEAQHYRPEVLLDVELCRRCGQCVENCEPGRHQILDQERVLRDGVHCTACLLCVDGCQSGALRSIGRTVTVAETMAELARHEATYRLSGGGVTISGGEPLFQADYTIALLEACRERGWHTAVDTSGYGPAEVFAEVARLADLLLFDLKESDPLLHGTWTGVPLEPLLANLRHAAANGCEVWVRLPVVPLANDRDDHWHATAELLGELPQLPPVWLLPYQRLGEAKRPRLGLPEGLLHSVEPPDATRLEQIATLLRRHGLEVHLPAGR